MPFNSQQLVAAYIFTHFLEREFFLRGSRTSTTCQQAIAVSAFRTEKKNSLLVLPLSIFKLPLSIFGFAETFCGVL